MVGVEGVWGVAGVMGASAVALTSAGVEGVGEARGDAAMGEGTYRCGSLYPDCGPPLCGVDANACVTGEPAPPDSGSFVGV